MVARILACSGRLRKHTTGFGPWPELSGFPVDFVEHFASVSMLMTLRVVFNDKETVAK
jgi:hypothetical protein